MSVSLRSHLTAGVAALAATAIALAPTDVTAARQAPAGSNAHVSLAASVQPLVSEPLRPEQLAAARAAIGRIDPDAAARLPTVLAGPAPQNAASDFITSSYLWIQGWVDYGVDLAQYVLQFIPYGYLISAQVGIVYDVLITPIANSVVFDLINPIVNDPLNIWTYVNGAIAVGQTTIASLINTGIAELNYFFGWLIPPLPPLPLTALETAGPSPAASVEVLDEPVDAATLEVSDAAEPDPGVEVESSGPEQVIEDTAAEAPGDEPVEPTGEEPVEPTGDEPVEPTEDSTTDGETTEDVTTDDETEAEAPAAQTTTTTTSDADESTASKEDDASDEGSDDTTAKSDAA